MLNNRADKLVLKAFLELPVPEALHREDAALAARCGDELHSVANRLLVGRSGTIEIRTPQLISKEDKAALNAAITRLADGEAKRELVFFYRLAILVELVILKYRV